MWTSFVQRQLRAFLCHPWATPTASPARAELQLQGAGSLCGASLYTLIGLRRSWNNPFYSHAAVNSLKIVYQNFPFQMTMQFLSPTSTVIGAQPLVQRQGETVGNSYPLLRTEGTNGTLLLLTSLNIALVFAICTGKEPCRIIACLKGAMLGEATADKVVHIEKWSEVKILVAQSCPTLCNPMDYIPPGSSVCRINSPGMNTRVDRHSLLQGIFLTQVSNLGPLHCRQILDHLSNERILKSYLTDTQTSWRKCCQCSIKTMSLLTSALYPLVS